MPRGKRLVRIVLVQAEQSSFAAAPDEDHRAARALTSPPLAFERGEAVGETLAQIADRR